MTYHSDHFFDIWSSLVEVLNTSELGIVASISKEIWNRRNEIVHGKELRHPTKIYNQALEEFTLYTDSLQASGKGRDNPRVESHKWKKPVENHYKVNWDAAVRSVEGRIGIGVIVRDHTG
ncbi:uncharacterized protein LOC122278632 [Carya illinoinensis]|uniref:uncharacterized protein LOC122278632 n=1 Tax=Carya illinoinensis TaxID=32201 RepID=UPI001C71FCD6|nr:uncharacterized protein LOC122278632 [Carya illinoinensis]